jgi:hypothetical protein
MRRIVPVLLLFFCGLVGCQQKPSSEPTAQAPPAQPTPSASPVATASSASAPAKTPKAEPAPSAAKAPSQKPPDHPLQLADSPLGIVTFDHAKHKLECVTCHHASRPEKPATAAEQACRSCHTKPPHPGMKTVRQAAFHNPTATAGTCIDCHKKSGVETPTACKQCHVKGAA